MTELKEKIVKFLLKKGKKSTNEKRVRISFKKLNINYKKKVKSVLQFIVYWSSFIFKFSTKANSSYFFISKERINSAIKQIVKYNFFQKDLEVFKKEFQAYKKLQTKFVINKKLLHFYRWNTNK